MFQIIIENKEESAGSRNKISDDLLGLRRHRIRGFHPADRGRHVAPEVGTCVVHSTQSHGYQSPIRLLLRLIGRNSLGGIAKCGLTVHVHGA